MRRFRLLWAFTGVGGLICSLAMFVMAGACSRFGHRRIIGPMWLNHFSTAVIYDEPKLMSGSAKDWSAYATIALVFATGILCIGYPLTLIGSQQTQSHRCARCSYDLTGNTSGVCPECGTVISAKAE